MTAAVYHKITNDIIAAMDRDGVPPWVKPWSSVKTVRLWEPVNGRTGRRYSSINVMVLAEACQKEGYPVNEWWTLRQVAEVGGSIKAGERGQTVLFSKPMLVMGDGTIASGNDMPSGDDLPDGSHIAVWSVAYTVFNHSQCEGLPEPRSTPHPLGSALPGKPRAEALIRANKHLPTIKWDGGNRAFYRPGTDAIHMPARASFHGIDELYSTLFHECTHSTGHPKRLNRKSLAEAVKFGDVSYAKEELVAEMGAAFLCALTGIENTQVRLNTLAYLKGWRDRISKDPRLIVTAASQAQAAADYILAGSKAKPGMPAEEGDQPNEEHPEPTKKPAKPAAKRTRKASTKAPRSRRTTKVNPGPAEFVGLGRFLRCIVRLPDGRRAALALPLSSFLAWDPTTKRLAVLYPNAQGDARPLTGSTASRHAHFHGAAPSAGVPMVDPGPVGKGWQQVGLLESVTYHRANIISPARGEAEWLHQFGDRGEAGHAAADLEAPSTYPETLMPMLWTNAEGQVAIQRRRGNRYTVRDWIVG